MLQKHPKSEIMSTPVLSKKQQKKALSVKKTPSKGLRNVLAQPYEFFWPILKNENTDELKHLLQTSMPAIRRHSPHIPWSNLHRKNKIERQAVRKEARLKLDIPIPDEKVLNSIAMGVNEVTRLLEKDNALCILLEANVEPMFLIKHIVSMADLKNVSVILVPSLKSVMLETVGFSCIAFALKKMVKEADHHFHKLFKKVVELAGNFERNRPPKLDFKPNIGSASPVEEIVIIPAKSGGKQVIQIEKSFTLSLDVYKYRMSRKERVFIPESTTVSETVERRLDEDFIRVGKDIGCALSDTRHVKGEEKTRYVDIHAENDENSSETKDDDMRLDEYVTLDPERKLSCLLGDQETDADSVILNKTKSAILEIGDQSRLNLRVDKPLEKISERNKNFKYQSLKVKRLQGNSKRVKSTKVPKLTKK